MSEYFEVVQVVVRDSRENIFKYLQDEGSGIWLAYHDGEPAGCISLRPLTPTAGEVKRLYVRTRFRRMGIAQHLLTALESHAASARLQMLYLDTKDDMPEAIAFYARAGYQRCERYNDNPQATIFLQKSLAAPLEVRHFRAGDEEVFWSLNEAWISKLFVLEEKDIQTLRDPQRYILAAGGRVFIACRAGETVGCCALLKRENGTYEIGKMAVAERERGRGVGRKLLEYALAEARKLGARRLYLETNHKLVNAIHLYESIGFSHLDPTEIAPSPYARSNVFMEMMLTG